MIRDEPCVRCGAYDYGLCPVCGLPMRFERGEDVDLHSTEDGSDCHAECCPTCPRDPC